MRRSWSPRSRVHGLPMGRPIHGPLGAPSPAQVLGPQGEPRRMPALSIRTASKESLQSAARHIPADRSRAGGRSAGHSQGDASDSLLPWRATSWGSPPRRSRHRLPPSIHEGPGLTGARDPRPRPAGRLRPADGGRCALTGRCHATRQFMFRLRRLAFTHPHRSAVRAARKWFLPRPSSRRSRVCPSTAPDRGARGGLAGSQHPRLRPLAGTVPPNTEKEKWCGMLQRAPTVARLAPKSGQRCFGSR